MATSGLVNLADVVVPPARIRKSLAALTIGATWHELVRAEPKLEPFLQQVREVSRWFGDRNCWVQAWPQIQDALARFVGDRDAPVFYAAARVLEGVLRPCRHCLQRDLLEADIENDYANYLRLVDGVEVKQQVSVSTGIIDILTPSEIIETKLALTRGEIFKAVGQLTAYKAALEYDGRDRKKVIVGQLVPGTENLVAYIRLTGFEVIEW